MKPKTKIMRGMIIPMEGASLKPIWKAFRQGTTWVPVGKKAKNSAKYRHAAQTGYLRFEWWGKALRYELKGLDNGGKFVGYFLGHVQRHGFEAVERLDISFLSE
jgi:hypothetical protein